MGYVTSGAHRAGEGACNLYKRQNSNMAVYAKISNIHIWRLWDNAQVEGNVKLGFHMSASLTAVSDTGDALGHRYVFWTTFA